MRNISGVSGAAPIWNEFMRTALADEPVIEFTPPPGVRQYEVCADTGTLPSVACPQKAVHWFAEDRPPLPAEQDLYQRIKLERLTGKLATEFTPADAIEEKDFKVYPERYRPWAEAQGIAQPPNDASDVYTFEPRLAIREPVEGEIVSGIVTIIGSAEAPAFASYALQYGISHDPGAFSAPFVGPIGAPVIDGVLGEWDTRGLAEGPHTLRLVVRDQSGAEREVRVRLFVVPPTPTPPPVDPTATWTIAAPTAVPLPTDTLAAPATAVPATPVVEVPTNTPVVDVPTATPLPVEPTVTPLPTETPVPTDTPALEATPTWTIEAPTAEPTAASAAIVTATVPLTSSETLTGTGILTGSALITGTE
jgi:hypothetical protein